MKHEIARFITRKITLICANERSAPAMLANLRRGLGTAPGERPELWPLLFDGMPEEMLSRNGQPTHAEWAVHIALTLFALHQQGKDVTEHCMHKEDCSLGQALNRLAAGDEDAQKRIKRRFDAMATADRITETAYHLRGLVQLLRAADIPLDYARLGEELYFIQQPNGAPGVRLHWGQDFYRIAVATKNNTEENKEELQ